MRTRIMVTVAAALVAFAPATPVFATDGYFMSGYGTGQKGMAGAGIALLFGPSDTVNNPAAGAFSGAGADFGIAAFSPKREFEVTGTPSGLPGTVGLQPGTVTSDSNWFPVPRAAVGWNLGRSAAFTVAMYSHVGMNTTYDAPVFGGSIPTGIDLQQLFVAPSLSVKLSQGMSLGASVVVAYQRFEAKGLQPFTTVSSAPAKVTDNGPSDSYGVGYKLGYLGNLAYVTLGIAYQSRITMGEFENYAGLLAEQGRFDIPSSWTVGIAVRPGQGVDLAVDVQRINYSGVKSISNPMLPNLQTARLGEDEGAGLGWKDMTVVKVGMQYRAAPTLVVRSGYSYGEQPIPESEMLFNILAPGVVRQHVTTGFTQAVSNRSAVHVAITRALSHSASGPNLLDAPGQQQIKLSMSQWDYEVAYSIKW